MERFFILLILAGLSVSGVAQKSMWLIAGQSNASGMGDRRTSMKYYSKECFDYVQSGDSLKILQDPVGENGKYFGKANSGSISPSFAWNLNKMTGDSVVVVSAAREEVHAPLQERQSTVLGRKRVSCLCSMQRWLNVILRLPLQD